MRYIIRDYDPEQDGRLVVSSWVAGFLDLTEADGAPARAAARALVDRLIERSSVRVLCSATDSRHILGWAAAEGDCLHWVYVKAGPLLRRQGLGTALVEDAGRPTLASITTRVCRPGKRCWAKWGLTYDPRSL